MHDQIRKKTFEILDTSVHPITPLQLINTLSRELNAPKAKTQSVLKELVTRGHLAYTFLHGHSFIEKSIRQPVRVSKHVVIKPPQVPYRLLPSDVVVEITTGAAFGNGHHPSTRLAIQGIEHGLLYSDPLINLKPAHALVFGCGSGILAFTALRFGVTRATGIDIDPCARHESGNHAILNGLADRFSIQLHSIEEIIGTFDLVIANLRTPTLIRICPKVEEITKPRGIVVLSGIRPDEADDVVRAYHTHGFDKKWSRQEKEWVGLVFHNR